MKTLLIFLVFFVFLAPPILSQNTGVQSENWYYAPDVVTILDTVNTFSSLLENTQIFSSYGYTTLNGGWYMQTSWYKDFESYPIIPDTFAIDIRVTTQTNLSEIRLGIAMQDSFYYGWDVKQSFDFSGGWQTLKFETSLFKSFLNNFIKFYLVFLFISEDSCYIGAVVEVDDFGGIYNDLDTTIMYDDFDRPSSIIPIEQNPSDFVLEQNYPNPFNPSTTIRFSIERQSEVNLAVFNSLGQEVKTLILSRDMAEGAYEVLFDASELPSGVYFYRLQVGNFVETKKMMFLK